MASSKVMSSNLISEDGNRFGSISMDELIRNIYGNQSVTLEEEMVDTKIEMEQQPVALTLNTEMTLEEFLSKTGALSEEDVKINAMVGPVHGFVVDSGVVDHGKRLEVVETGDGGVGGSGGIVWLGDGTERGGGRGGKRRAVHEPLDKAAQQRQRRMIKNRESAARSRERKQAYTVELETLVTKLEEENARLIREQEEKAQERYKQLMKHLIPVEEKQRSPRVLRRVRSMHW